VLIGFFFTILANSSTDRSYKEAESAGLILQWTAFLVHEIWLPLTPEAKASSRPNKYNCSTLILGAPKLAKAASSCGTGDDAAGRRRSADAELWRPSESDVVRGPGTKSGSCAYCVDRLDSSVSTRSFSGVAPAAGAK
jgi:hypothetical protein